MCARSLGAAPVPWYTLEEAAIELDFAAVATRAPEPRSGQHRLGLVAVRRGGRHQMVIGVAVARNATPATTGGSARDLREVDPLPARASVADVTHNSLSRRWRESWRCGSLRFCGGGALVRWFQRSGGCGSARKRPAAGSRAPELLLTVVSATGTLCSRSATVS